MINLTVKEKNDLGEVYECLVVDSVITKTVYAICWSTSVIIKKLSKICRYK